MRNLWKLHSGFAALLVLAGCAVAPTEPGILALPGSGRTLEQFQGDDVECRRYAGARVTGAAGGAASYDAQRRFDFAFVQCMYAKGHKVPVSGGYTNAPAGAGAPPPGVAPAEVFIAPPAANPASQPAPKE